MIWTCNESSDDAYHESIIRTKDVELVNSVILCFKLDLSFSFTPHQTCQTDVNAKKAQLKIKKKVAFSMGALGITSGLQNRFSLPQKYKIPYRRHESWTLLSYDLTYLLLRTVADQPWPQSNNQTQASTPGPTPSTSFSTKRCFSLIL